MSARTLLNLCYLATAFGVVAAVLAAFAHSIIFIVLDLVMICVNLNNISRLRRVL